MKTYVGTRVDGLSHITVDGEALPMRRFVSDRKIVEFGWGSRGDQALRVAISLLCDAVDEFHAAHFAQTFADDIIAKLAPGAEWELSSDEIKEYIDFECAAGYDAEHASFEPCGSPCTTFASAPLLPPRILVNPNYKGSP